MRPARRLGCDAFLERSISVAVQASKDRYDVAKR